MTAEKLTLVSHHLCPYVQRAAIALSEKGAEFDRRDVDLANKPAWFLDVSPLGKTPVLIAHGRAIFESAVILEYLEETLDRPLHPADPLQRAEHRGWIEFASATLNDIAGVYGAPDQSTLDVKAAALQAKLDRIEQRLSRGPYFDGARFSLVDAAFAPVFRYFDAFDRIPELGIRADLPKIAAWRLALSDRPSVRSAVGADYDERLWAFLAARGSKLSTLIAATGPMPATSPAP